MATTTSALRRVAILGAGGNLGKYIVTELRKDPSFHITIITRQSSKATFDKTSNVIKVPDDYPRKSMIDAFRDQDVVIASLNFQAFAKQPALIDAAIEAGVKWFIPADFGGTAENSLATELFPVSKGTEATLEYLRTKEGSGLAWTALVPGLFIDLALPNGLLGLDVPHRKMRIWDTGTARFACSTRPHIARAVHSILLHPSQTRNQIIYTASFIISLNDLFQCARKITNTEESEWEVQHVKTDEMVKNARGNVQKGDLRSMIDLACAVTFGGKCGTDFEERGVLKNGVLGLEKEDLSQVLRGIMGEMGTK